MRRTVCAFVVMAGLAVGAANGQLDVSSQWTYQGQLLDAGIPANGTYHFQFKLYDQEQGSLSIASYGSASNPIVREVAGGTFSAEVDFGYGPFSGPNLWIEVLVRPAGSGAFTTLPRQRVTAAPYAMFSSKTRGINVEVSGRVSLGGQATTAQLTINAPSSGEGLDVRSTNASWTRSSLVNTSSGGRHWAWLSTGAGHPTGAGDMVLRDVTGNVDRLVVGSDGNIGIGVSQPNAKLHVGGRVKCQTLELVGGSDIAEPYRIAAAGEVKPQAGMVVCVDREQVGGLRVSEKAYDRAVVGIISGANGVNPGLTLTQEGTIADGELPVANAGRVWCWVDAGAGAVEPGDLLTTSSVPGHAMKADAALGNGAIIGKAMSSLESGRGLVLVFVGLQ